VYTLTGKFKVAPVVN